MPPVARLVDSRPAHRTAAPLCPLGTIVNTHGIRGEVRLLPYNPNSATLRAGESVTLRWPDRTVRVLIRALRPHKRFRLLQLEGYDTATAANDLVGAELCVDAEQLPQLAPGEIYHRDLIGLRVKTTDGRELGVIESMMSTGSNDVCVVRSGGREHLIPLIADVVREIDTASGWLVIDPIPGLLDE